MPNDDAWAIVPVCNEAGVGADVVAGLIASFPHAVHVDDGIGDESAEAAPHEQGRSIDPTARGCRGGRATTACIDTPPHGRPPR